MLSHFLNRYEGVYSEKTFNFDIHLSKIVLYMQCYFGYMLFFWVSFENSAVQYERVEF